MHPRTILALVASSVLAIGGIWLAVGIVQAPEWTPGDSWSYRVTSGDGGNVLFEVVEVTRVADLDVWRVNVTHERPGDTSRSTRYFDVRTLDEVYDECGEGAFGRCRGVERLFDFPIVTGEFWTWERGGDVQTRVVSRAGAWMGEATVTHYIENDWRLVYEYETGDPFFHERRLVNPDGSVERWVLDRE